MKRFIIKEPDEKEFKAFKREFLQKKSKEYYDSDTRNQIDLLMRENGKLTSFISEQNIVIDELRGQARNSSTKINFKSLSGKMPRNTARQYIMNLLSEALFNDLKTGKLYNL
jgi:hypothetical protein